MRCASLLETVTEKICETCAAGQVRNAARADGGGEPEPLTQDDTHSGQIPTSVSPDGRFVLITNPGGAKAVTLTIDATDPDHPKAGATVPLLTEAGIIGSTISPDVRWLAFTFVGLR